MRTSLFLFLVLFLVSLSALSVVPVVSSFLRLVVGVGIVGSGICRSLLGFLVVCCILRLLVPIVLEILARGLLVRSRFFVVFRVGVLVFCAWGILAFLVCMGSRADRWGRRIVYR